MTVCEKLKSMTNDEMVRFLEKNAKANGDCYNCMLYSICTIDRKTDCEVMFREFVESDESILSRL